MVGLDGTNDLDDMEDESEASSSGAGWDSGRDDDVDDNIMEDEDQEDVEISDDETSEAELEADGAPIRKRSLVISLKVPKKAAQPKSDLEDSGKQQEMDAQPRPQSTCNGHTAHQVSEQIVVANNIQYTPNGIKAEGHPSVEGASLQQAPFSKMTSHHTMNGVQPAPISLPVQITHVKQQTQTTGVAE